MSLSGFETINPLTVIEQKQRAHEVFPKSGLSILPMLRQRKANDTSTSNLFDLHTDGDIEICGEVEVSVGLIVPSKLEKLNTVLEVEEWVTNYVEMYRSTIRSLKEKLGEGNKNAENDHSWMELMFTMETVAAAHLTKLMLDHCISKSENIEINDEESDDEDEASQEKMPTAKVSSETIVTENDDDTSARLKVLKKMTDGDMTNADILNLVKSLKDNFDAKPEVVYLEKMHTNYLKKVKSRKSAIYSQRNEGGNEYEGIRGNSSLSLDLLKVQDDYILKILLSEEEYVETLQLLVEHVVNPALAYHSGAVVEGGGRGMKSLRPWRRRETSSDALKADSEDKKEDETKAIIALNALKQVATLHEEFLNGLREIINNANAPLKISFTFEDHARLAT